MEVADFESVRYFGILSSMEPDVAGSCSIQHFGIVNLMGLSGSGYSSVRHSGDVSLMGLFGFAYVVLAKRLKAGSADHSGYNQLVCCLVVDCSAPRMEELDCFHFGSRKATGKLHPCACFEDE